MNHLKNLPISQSPNLSISNLPISNLVLRIVCCVFVMVLLAACWQPSLEDLPFIPKELGDARKVLEDLGLGDVVDQVDFSQLPVLPEIATPPGAINFNGPTAVTVSIGDLIPGTDIKLISINKDGGEFQIAGLNTVRKMGDSLDFEGTWPQLPDVNYSVRLRIFFVGSESVRAAGVHRLIIPNIAPQVGAAANLQLGGHQLKFSFVDSANLNEAIAGTTLVFAGQDERGGVINGLPTGTYNFFKVGDSLRWIGLVRADIAAEYNMRMIFYSATSAQLGGTVTVAMPTK